MRANDILRGDAKSQDMTISNRIVIEGKYQRVGKSRACFAGSRMLAEVLFENTPERRAFEKGNITMDRNLSLPCL